MPVCTSARPRVTARDVTSPSRLKRYSPPGARTTEAAGVSTRSGVVAAAGRLTSARPRREREQIDRQGFERARPDRARRGSHPPRAPARRPRRGRGDRRRTRGRPARAAWRRRRGSPARRCPPAGSDGAVCRPAGASAGWAMALAGSARATARASGRTKTSTFMGSFQPAPWHRTGRPAVLSVGLATYSNGRGGATERLTPNA